MFGSLMRAYYWLGVLMLSLWSGTYWLDGIAKVFATQYGWMAPTILMLWSMVCFGLFALPYRFVRDR